MWVLWSSPAWSRRQPCSAHVTSPSTTSRAAATRT
jgi:hypothetical protein